MGGIPEWTARSNNMAQPSRVELLSPELRERLHALLQDPAITLAQVADTINDEAGGGAPVVSKSGVHRYAQRMRRWAEQNRQARLVVQELSQQLGAEGAQRFSEAMIFSLRTMVFDVIGAVRALRDDMDEDAEPAAVAAVTGLVTQLTLALQRIESAESRSARRRRELREEMAREAAEVAGQEAQRAGLSDATVEAIKQRVLGVA